jgi:hypothetical protein
MRGFNGFPHLTQNPRDPRAGRVINTLEASMEIELKDVISWAKRIDNAVSTDKIIRFSEEELYLSGLVLGAHLRFSAPNNPLKPDGRKPCASKL